jgi:hypothetical protein
MKIYVSLLSMYTKLEILQPLFAVSGKNFWRARKKSRLRKTKQKICAILWVEKVAGACKGGVYEGKKEYDGEGVRGVRCRAAFLFAQRERYDVGRIQRKIGQVAERNIGRPKLFGGGKKGHGAITTVAEGVP